MFSEASLRDVGGCHVQDPATEPSPYPPQGLSAAELEDSSGWSTVLSTLAAAAST